MIEKSIDDALLKPVMMFLHEILAFHHAVDQPQIQEANRQNAIILNRRSSFEIFGDE